MDLFHRYNSYDYVKCGVRNCTCFLEAYDSKTKKESRRKSRTRLKIEDLKIFKEVIDK